MDKIRDVIEEFIDEQESVGEKSGGSGHMSSVSCKISKINWKKVDGKSYHIVVEIEYIRAIETEFTYYPDNPPIEDTFRQTLYLDDQLQITGFTAKNFLSSNQDVPNLLFDDSLEEN